MTDRNPTDERQMGKPPVGANCFRLLKKNQAGKFAKVSLPSNEPGSPALDIFPVELANSQWISTWVGPGEYKIQWLKDDGETMSAKGAGRAFSITSRAPVVKKKKKVELGDLSSSKRDEFEAFRRIRELEQKAYENAMNIQSKAYELQIERERLNAQERMVQTQEFWKAQTAAMQQTRAQAAAPAISEEMVNLRVRLAQAEARSERERDDDDDEPEPQQETESEDAKGVLSEVRKMFEALPEEARGMIVTKIMAKFATPSAGSGGGGGGAPPGAGSGA